MMAQDPPIELEEGWSYIEENGFKPLLACLDANRDSKKAFPSYDLMTLNYKVYCMCTQKQPKAYPDELYWKIRKTINQYLEDKALEAVKRLSNEFLLQELGRRWENHKILVEWVKHRFSYIDRFWVKREEMASLGEVGYTCFKEVVFSAISTDVKHALLSLVQQERDGQLIDTSLLKAIKDIFVEMGMSSLEVYDKELERPFLDSTREFYKRESARWAEEYSFHDFMVQAEKSVEAELVRTRAYLHPKTEDIVRKCCEEEILNEHQLRMLNKENSGLVVMLEHNHVGDLKRLYRLYSPMHEKALKPIADIFKKHIESEGMALVEFQKNRMDVSNDGQQKSSSEAAKSDFECIESLLSLHDRYLNLVSECFEDDTIFRKAMKEAFEVFVNQHFGQSSTAELFANYSDSLLSQNGMGAKMEEEKIESMLDKLVALFEHLSEKDLFQEFAQKQLAKRLLMEKSISEGLERSFIQKLKTKGGCHFTIKLEGMITDINISEDFRKKFRDWYRKKTAGDADADKKNEDESSSTVNIKGIGFSAHVLKSGHWPSYQREDLKLAPELAECIELFKEHYSIETSQRVLRWAHSLGKGNLISSAFEGNPKIPKVEFTVSCHQMCILLLFNDLDELTYEQIRMGLRNTGAHRDDDNMRQNMATLVTKKYPLLLKRTEGGVDIFSLNTKWGSQKRLVRLPMPSPKITVEESKAVHIAVEEDRKHAIESAIVRVMKYHHKMEHQNLLVEVSRQLLQVFTPEPLAIKYRIEDLIQREYLKRDSLNPSVYHYLA